MTASPRRAVLRGLIGGTLAAPVIMRGALGQPKHSMKLAFADVASSPFRIVLQNFADDVRERTGGAVDIKVYSLGELGSQNNILTGMQVGIVDFAAHTTGFIQTLFPRFAVLDLPYLFKDAATGEKVLDGAVGQTLFSDMPAKGIYGLSWLHWGWRPVTTVDRPVPKPSDLKGLKIRVQAGAIYAETYKTLGAVPISIDASEVYLALSQHAVDAVEVPIISLVAQKDYEVAKIVNLTNFVYNAGAIMASKRRFDTLGPEYQAAIKEASRTASTAWRATTVKLTVELTGFIKQQGLQVLPVDDEAYRVATRPIYDQFRPLVGADLLDAVVKQAASG
jgi:tripartite ATP-independent transporter DctP family solute receptor